MAKRPRKTNRSKASDRAAVVAKLRSRVATLTKSRDLAWKRIERLEAEAKDDTDAFSAWIHEVAEAVVDQVGAADLVERRALIARLLEKPGEARHMLYAAAKSSLSRALRQGTPLMTTKIGRVV